MKQREIEVDSKRMNSQARKAFFLCAWLAVAVAAAQAGFFAFFMFAGQPLQPKQADLVVVFDGDRDRVRRGFELGNNGVAPTIMVSSARVQRLHWFEKTYGRRPDLKYLVEDQARTTFENALYAARAIRGHGINSVVLVTSSYHLPRSYFLLRLTLMGTPVRVKTYAVADPLPEPGASVRSLKMTYNEMVKFWGSLGEAALYKLRGNLPGKSPREMAAIQSLKRMLLFEV